jgi:hypothetical protein
LQTDPDRPNLKAANLYRLATDWSVVAKND